jgi:nucleoside-diphosphate-sugar epimerase
MRTALITGAAGFVGSHLVDACLSRGDDVIAVDAFTPYYGHEIKWENTASWREHPSCTLLERNLLDLELPALLEQVDVVFHLAAQAGVRASWGESFEVYVEHNVRALQHLLEAAKQVELSRFVFASSSSVYGDAESLPTPEDSILRPVSPYGATKVLGENLCYLYAKSYGVPAVSLRYFTVYGPRQRPDMSFHRLINATFGRDSVEIYGDGRQTRDFTFVEDIVQGTLAAAERGEPGRAYNLGGGTRIALSDVIQLIRDLSGEEPTVRHLPAQRGDARDTAADTSRARMELGFTPRVSLPEGLAAQIDWQRAATLTTPVR